MAASLLIAVGDVEPLIDKIVKTASAVPMGAGLGAIIDQASQTRIKDIIGRAEKAGAKVRLDGRNATPPDGCAGGYWLGPTIIDNVRPDMECVTTEIFGPVLTIMRVKTIAEAMDLENKVGLHQGIDLACIHLKLFGHLHLSIAGWLTQIHLFAQAENRCPVDELLRQRIRCLENCEQFLQWLRPCRFQFPLLPFYYLEISRLE